MIYGSQILFLMLSNFEDITFVELFRFRLSVYETYCVDRPKP